MAKSQFHSQTRPFTSWLRSALRENGATVSQARRLTSPSGIAKFLKREAGGRYGIGSISVSDYSARGLRKEALPSVERRVSSEAAKTGRPVSEILQNIVPSRQYRASVERELSREIAIGGKTFKVHPHSGRRAFEHKDFLNRDGRLQSAVFAGDDLLAMQKYRDLVERVRKTKGRDAAANRDLAAFGKTEIHDVNGNRIHPETDPRRLVAEWASLSKSQKAERERIVFYSRKRRRGTGRGGSSGRASRPSSGTARKAGQRTSRGH